MANPLQPKVAKTLEKEYDAFVIVNTATSKAGMMDIVASVNGLFYGFEVKWKTDTPSELQKQKINELIDKGGRGYFIKSIPQLREILDKGIAPVKYALRPSVRL